MWWKEGVGHLSAEACSWRATGVGGMGRAILCERVCMCSLGRSAMFNSFQPARLLCPWGFIGKNTGVGCHFLLQGIFLTQRSNLRLLCLLHWQACSLSLHHLGAISGKIQINVGCRRRTLITVFVSYDHRNKVPKTKTWVVWNNGKFLSQPSGGWFSRWVVSDSWDPMDGSLPGSSIHGILQVRILGCHFLLQGIFPTQESNPDLLLCRQILYQLSYERSPFWKLEILNQGVGNVGSFWEFAGSICSKPLSWLLVTAGNPYCSSAYRGITPTSASNFTWPSPFVALSLNFPLLRTPVITDEGLPLIMNSL